MATCPVQEEHVNVRSTDTPLSSKAPPPAVESGGAVNKGGASDSELAQALNLLQETIDIDNDKDEDDYEDALRTLNKALSDDLDNMTVLTKGIQKDVKELSAKLAAQPSKYLAPLCDENGNLSKAKVDTFLEAQNKNIQKQIEGLTDELSELTQTSSEESSTTSTTEEAPTTTQETPPSTTTEDDDTTFSTGGGTASYVAGAKTMSDLAGSEGYIEYALNETMFAETKRNSDASEVMIESASSLVDDAIKQEEDYERAVRKAKRKAHQNSILGHCLSAVAVVAACCTCNPVIIAAVLVVVADQEQASIRSDVTGKEQKTGMDYATTGIGEGISAATGCPPKTAKLIADVLVVVAVSAITAGAAGGAAGAAAAEGGAEAAAVSAASSSAAIGAGLIAGGGMLSYTKTFDDTAEVVIAAQGIDENSQLANNLRMTIACVGFATSMAMGGVGAYYGGAFITESMAQNLSGTAMTCALWAMGFSVASEIGLNAASASLSYDTGRLYQDAAKIQRDMSETMAALTQVNSATDQLSTDTDLANSTYSGLVTQIGDSTNSIIQAAADYAFSSVVQA